MRPSVVIAFVFGLGLASGAVVIVAKKLSSQPAPAPVMAAIPQEPAIELSPVVVAAAAIGYGDAVGKTALRLVEWPKEHAPDQGFGALDEVFSQGAPTALSPIAEGEPLLRSKLSGFGGDHSLAATLPSGKRAFTVRINDVSGVAGFVTPGDQVDVLLTRRVGDEDTGDIVAKVILQNVVVIGIDQATEAAGSDRPRVGRTATVEVTPEEAQTLALAMQVGALSLVLRRIGSDETVDVGFVSANEVFGIAAEPEAAPEPAASAPKPQPTMRIRRGGEVSKVVTER